MAPSQLKQLKVSLKEHGVLGPQKSKKQRKLTAKDGQKKLQRNAALEGIRERFNPFEAKAPSRRDKFDIASNKPTKRNIERPGVTRGLGEERRRATLLKEMQTRNKVGGMMDRRFGEDDPTMTPEEKAAERFARQAMRISKKNSMFNLENESDEEIQLTHGGKALAFGGETPRDDFEEDDMAGSDGEIQDDRPRKRLRMDDENEIQDEDEEELEEGFQPKRSKNEVMKEVIAKSKLYKAARQAAKADDEDLRIELDKDMGDFYRALQGHNPPERQLLSPPRTDSEPAMDPSRAAMLAGKSREEAEKDYEANLRQLRLDARSKPTVRTKTDEEKAAEEKARLEELERKRLRRMKGESESSDEEEEDDKEELIEDDDEQDDAEPFGLAQPTQMYRPQLDVEDEDEFVLDDLVVSDGDPEMSSDDESSNSGGDDIEPDDDGDDDFINGLVLPKALPDTYTTTSKSQVASPANLAYTYPCPQSHPELLEIFKDIPSEDLPTVIQRIRALHHKGLAEGNQEKLGKFAQALVAHVIYLADADHDVSFLILEQLLRHVHSMAKDQPEEVCFAVREHLRIIAAERPLELTIGDLILLTGVSTMFPTSDQWHSVVTPAMLSIARYLGQSNSQSLQDLGKGAYCCSLALQYQSRSLRYVPEVITYIGKAIVSLAPEALLPDSPEWKLLSIPLRISVESMRISKQTKRPSEKISLTSLRSQGSLMPESLLHCFLNLTKQCTGLWSKKSAYPDLIQPLQSVISYLTAPPNAKILSESTVSLVQETLSLINSTATTSVHSRKPLLLHKHRPLAIKSSYPAFIDNYNPGRHYDPDRERAELAKLKAEHKKERKGAMRELRKDANFIAREQLREKKAKDEAYEKKFKRLVAEIQGEEGREAKEYEREKAKRQGKR